MTTESEHATESAAARPEELHSEAVREPSPPGPTASWKKRVAGQLAMTSLGLLAGALGAEVIYHTQEILPPPDAIGNISPSPEVIATANRNAMISAAVGFSLAGALVGAALGCGLWFLRGSVQVALRGALTGLVAGAVFGALGGALNRFFAPQVTELQMDSLLQAMLVHAPEWICLSVAVGLATGLPLRGVSTTKVIGATFAAAILAALLYPLLSMLLFPAAHTELPVPRETGARILWFALGAGLLGWAAARSVEPVAAAHAAR